MIELMRMTLRDPLSGWRRLQGLPWGPGDRWALIFATSACSASIFASGDACTPAAQIRVRQRMVSSPSGFLTVTDSSSIATAREFRLTSTPISSSCRCV